MIPLKCMMRGSYTSLQGDDHPERRALPGCALCPDPTAMALDDPMNGCQTEPVSLEFGLRVQAAKRDEQLLCVTRIEAHAVVAHEDDVLRIGNSTRKRASRRISPPHRNAAM